MKVDEVKTGVYVVMEGCEEQRWRCSEQKSSAPSLSKIN